MDSGVLGITSGTEKRISSEEKTRSYGDLELTACIDVIRTQNSVINGSDIQYGHAAIEEPVTEESVQIRDGKVTVSDDEKIHTKYTEFIYLPGEFAVVNSGSGTFAFDLIAAQIPGLEIERVEIDIDAFINSNENLAPWQVGFYGHVGDAEKGTIYGGNVLEDSDIGGPIHDSAKNQLGAVMDYNNVEVKFTITESGYINIYNPSNYEERDFSKFIFDEILPFVGNMS